MKLLIKCAVASLVFASLAQGAAIDRRQASATLVTAAATSTEGQAASASAVVATSTDSSARAAAATATNPCVAWEFLTTRGSGDSQSEPYWMSGFRNRVIEQVPNGKLVETTYNANDNGIFTIGDIVAGAVHLSSYANARSFECPNTKFVIAAYSKGAGVQGMGLQSMQGLGSKVLGIVYWGSPFYRPNREEDVGGAESGQGIYSWLGFRTPAIWRSITADICFINDSICTGTVDYSTSEDSHLNFKGTSWETYSVDFIVGKLRAAGF